MVISAVLLKSTFFALLFNPFKSFGMGRIDSFFFHFAQSDEAIIMLSLRKQKNSPTRVKRENR